jgi:hypothetical protein
MSEYMRVSCAYCVRNGLTAHSAAHMRPARRPNRLQPAHMPPGTDTSAVRTESAWVSPGPFPTTSIQTDSSM